MLSDTAETINAKTVRKINTGNYSDGKNFIFEFEDAIGIRAGERGEEAL